MWGLVSRTYLAELCKKNEQNQKIEKFDLVPKLNSVFFMYIIS